MTTIYLVRHSEPFKKHLGIIEVDENILFNNIKMPLSIDGEKLADCVSNNSEFNKLDAAWSSHYVRSMSTAKYFAEKNHLKVNISDKFGERVHGVESWDELPSDYEKRQMLDENYKINNGESQKEVRERLFNALKKIVNEYKDKRVLIVGHSTAVAFLLTKWCKIDNEKWYEFKDRIFFDGKWNYCQTFKLEFDNEINLINIESINI